MIRLKTLTMHQINHSLILDSTHTDNLKAEYFQLIQWRSIKKKYTFFIEFKQRFHFGFSKFHDGSFDSKIKSRADTYVLPSHSFFHLSRLVFETNYHLFGNALYFIKRTNPGCGNERDTILFYISL